MADLVIDIFHTIAFIIEEGTFRNGKKPMGIR